VHHDPGRHDHSTGFGSLGIDKFATKCRLLRWFDRQRHSRGSGGTSPYTYAIDGATFVRAALSAVSPQVRLQSPLKDANGCTTTQGVTITGPPQRLALRLVSQTNVACFGRFNRECDGRRFGWNFAFILTRIDGPLRQQRHVGNLPQVPTTVTSRSHSCTTTQPVTITQPASASRHR